VRPTRWARELEVNPKVRELFGAWLASSPFAKVTGLELTELEPDRATVVMPFDRRLTTLGDVVHGGAIATLLDVAAVAAAWSGVTDEGAATGATVSSSVNYTRAARGSDLTAGARATRRTSRFCFCDVQVTDHDERLVAQGIVTYRSRARSAPVRALAAATGTG
jgi:uncharacterized protein (TIGR00369 family)